MLAAALGSVLRWVLALGAGYLVEHGLWTNAEASVYVTGLSLALLSLGWSIWQKKVSRTKLVTALVGANLSEHEVEGLIKTGVVVPVSTPKSEVPVPITAIDPAILPKG